jgi:hypothetical protein
MSATVRRAPRGLPELPYLRRDLLTSLGLMAVLVIVMLVVLVVVR